jgi:hypothetical protein
MGMVNIRRIIMMTEQEYFRGLQRIQSQPPEMAAIKDTSSLVSGYAQSDIERSLDAERRGLERERMNALMENERRDVRMAKQDYPIALTLGVGNLGLNMLGAHEQRAEMRQAELEAKAQNDLIHSLMTIIKSYPEDMELFWRGAHPTQRAMASIPNNANPMSPMATTIGGG